MMPVMEDIVPKVQGYQLRIALDMTEGCPSLIRPFGAVDNPNPASTHIAQVLSP